MIDKDSIRDKDFSIEFPHIIAKLEFLGTILLYDEDDLVPEFYTTGLGAILKDIAEDLKVIKDTGGVF